MNVAIAALLVNNGDLDLKEAAGEKAGDARSN
jgi:hypothetical protein